MITAVCGWITGRQLCASSSKTMEDFDQVYQEWIQSGGSEDIQNVARYYMGLYGLSTVEYHYGVLDNLKTMYFMF